MTQSIPYVDRFPPGHEHEGRIIGRKAQCGRCGNDFHQIRINPAYIESIEQHKGQKAADSFKASCERTPKGFYQPPFCIACTRRIRS